MIDRQQETKAEHGLATQVVAAASSSLDSSAHCQALADFVLEAVPPGARVIQLGHDASSLALHLATRAGQVFVLDEHSAAIARLREQTRAQNVGNVTFCEGSILTFDAQERFDAVCLVDVLASIDDDNTFARHVLRARALLKPDGRLIVCDRAWGRVAGGDRTESRYLALVRSLGLRETARHQLPAGTAETSARYLYGFEVLAARPQSLPITGLRVACVGSMPFHFRSLAPLAECFDTHLLSLSIDEVMAWRPQVIVVADGWSVEFWRDYCDAHHVLLIGMRHGSVTRYGFAEPQYDHADYLCGSVWDIDDTLLSNVHPRQGFLLTGNAWVDQVFKLGPRPTDFDEPTILFAPTYNPEISAAVYFGDRIVELIRSVHPRATIIIKPHPAIVQHEHSFVAEKALFRQLMDHWRVQAAADSRVHLIDDPQASIADSFAKADILVADRSSLLFEFMVLDRPILLYSSDKRVAHWAYNADAPGNAWRDIGLEFDDDASFLQTLNHAHDLHRERCQAAQRRRVHELYGSFQDGRSVERVAAAIAQVPRTHVVIDGRDGRDCSALAEAFDARLAFKRISVLQPASRRGEHALDEWLGARGADDLGLLLVSADTAYVPGSAHQLNEGLTALAAGHLDAVVLQGSSVLPADTVQLDRTGWIRQRLHQALDNLQGQPAWQLLPAHALTRLAGRLPVPVDDEVFSILWQTLGMTRSTQRWCDKTLNVVFDAQVLRVVGGRVGHCLLGPQARLRLCPAVLGKAGQAVGVEVTLMPMSGQSYDVFPFTTQIWANDRCLHELVFRDAQAQRVVLPHVPDTTGMTHLEVRSTGACPGMPGLSGPLSLQCLLGATVDTLAPCAVHVQQIFYSAETQAMLDPGFVALNNTGQRPDWAEYWPIRTLLLGRTLDEEAFYGVLSPRFQRKTGLDSAQVFKFVRSAPIGTDVCLFPMFFDEAACFENVFLQGHFYHPEIWPACVEMARQLYPQVDLETLVMSGPQSQFCNYFIARPRFWRAWFDKAETIFRAAELDRSGERPSGYGAALNARTSHRTVNGYECKVFVMERLLPLMLACEPDWHVHAFDSLKLPTMRRAIDADYLELDRLKAELREQDHPGVRATYEALRQRLFWSRFTTRQHRDEASEPIVGEMIRASLRQYPALSTPIDPKDWLAARVPDVAQLRLIDERLAIGGAPRFGVLVLDMNGDAERLERTLSSLSTDNNLYSAVSIVALSTLELPGQTYAADKLRILRVDQNTMLRSIELAVHEGPFDWFMLVQAGHEFTRSGLLIAALDLQGTSGLRAVYGDEMLRSSREELSPIMRPDFNLDLLLAQPEAMGRHWLFNRDAWQRLGGFRSDSGRAFELDLIVRMIEDQGLSGFGHISEPLLICEPVPARDCADTHATVLRHLHARGFALARLEVVETGLCQIDYGVRDEGGVSILLCTEGRSAHVVSRCVESLLEKTRDVAYEVLLLDQSVGGSELAIWLAGIEQMQVERVRVLRFPASLPLAAVRNQAAHHARGEQLLWLDAAVVVKQADWLLPLLNHAGRSEVGAVGARLANAGGTLSQAGLVLGMAGVFASPWAGKPLDSYGYLRRLQVDHDCAALSGQCLMIGRHVFFDAGGFDEAPELAAFVDIDLCLRLHARGLLNVWTPRVTLVIDDDRLVGNSVVQEDALYARWLPVLARDPSYSVNLSLHLVDAFSLAPAALTWDPLSAWRPVPKVLVLAAADCTRLHSPMKALRQAGQLTGAIVTVPLSLTELERFAADSVVVQWRNDSALVECLRRIKLLSSVCIVLEISAMSTDAQADDEAWIASLKAAAAYVDRIVVPTPTLAARLAGVHDQVYAVPTVLDTRAWPTRGDQSRRPGRPRVAWVAQDAQAVLADGWLEAMKALHDEVEWHVLGDCPASMLPWVQVHSGPFDTDAYLDLLASLDFDLALMVATSGLAAEMRRDQRIVEFAASGVALMYAGEGWEAGSKPVIQLEKGGDRWIETVRAQVSDLEALRRRGKASREWAVAHHGVTEATLRLWQDAWSPLA